MERQARLHAGIILRFLESVERLIGRVLGLKQDLEIRDGWAGEVILGILKYLIKCNRLIDVVTLYKQLPGFLPGTTTSSNGSKKVI